MDPADSIELRCRNTGKGENDQRGRMIRRIAIPFPDHITLLEMIPSLKPRKRLVSARVEPRKNPRRTNLHLL